MCLSKSKPLIAIVDDDVSVCRAMKRLARSGNPLFSQPLAI